MSQLKLLGVVEVRQKLAQLLAKQQWQWLVNPPIFPLVINLGTPTQINLLNNPRGVNQWIEQWRAWQGGGELIWKSRRWSTLGQQCLPHCLVLNDLTEILAWVNKQTEWIQVTNRYQQLVEHWPILCSVPFKYASVLTTYTALEFSQLQAVLSVLLANPNANIYVRQLSVPGIDTKWIEAHQSLIIKLLQLLKNNPLEQNFYRLSGLKKEPRLLRLKILDSNLRAKILGLSDIKATVDDLATMDFSAVKQVYIVENLQTGLAFTDLPNSVVFMGLGYGVKKLSYIPWLKNATCYYWGDIDTHGLAILNRARQYLPQLKSLLMNEATLLKHKLLWGTEEKPYLTDNLIYLTNAEQRLYQQLLQHHWGYRVRLEQERIGWEAAWQVIQESCIVSKNFSAVD